MTSEGNGNSYATAVNRNRRRLSELRKMSRKLKIEMNALDDQSKVIYQGYLDSHGDKTNTVIEQTSGNLSWLPKPGLENQDGSSVNLDDRTRFSGVFSFVKSFIPDSSGDDLAPGSASNSNDLPLNFSESSQSSPMFFCGEQEAEKLKTMDPPNKNVFDLINSAAENLRTSLEHIPEDGLLEPQPITVRKMLGNIGKTNSDASLTSCTSYSSVFSDGTISSGTPTSDEPTSLDSGCTESMETLGRQLSDMFGQKTSHLPRAASVESKPMTDDSVPSGITSSDVAKSSSDAKWQQSAADYVPETLAKQTCHNQLTKTSYDPVVKTDQSNLVEASCNKLIESSCNQTKEQSNKQSFQSFEVNKNIGYVTLEKSDQEQGPSLVLQASTRTDTKHNCPSEHLSQNSGTGNSSEMILLEKSKADSYPQKPIRKRKKKAQTLTCERPVVPSQQCTPRKRRNTLDERPEHQKLKLARFHPSFSRSLIQKKENLMQDTISFLGQDSTDGASDQSFTNKHINRTTKLLNSESETFITKTSEKKKCYLNSEMKMLAITNKSLKFDSEILAPRRNNFAGKFKQVSVGTPNNRDETVSLLIRKRVYRSFSDPYIYNHLDQVPFSTSYERSVAKDHSKVEYFQCSASEKQPLQTTEKEIVTRPNNQTYETQDDLKGASSNVGNLAFKSQDIPQISSLHVFEKVLTESDEKVRPEEQKSSATFRDNGGDMLLTDCQSKNSPRRSSLPVLDSTNSGKRGGVFRKSLGMSSKANEVKSLCASVNVSNLRAGFEKRQEDEHENY